MPPKKAKAAVAEVAPIPKSSCDHLNIKNKNINGREVLVCMDCTRVVKPDEIPYTRPLLDGGNEDRGIVIQLPLPPDVRLCRKKDLDDEDRSFQWSLDVTEAMLLSVEDLPKLLPLADIRPGDRIRVYRKS